MAEMPQAKSSPSEEVNVLDLFSDEVRIPIEGLAFLGSHSTTVKYGGHTFGLRTLRQEYRYAIAQVVQPWRNTMAELNVWRDAHIAAALTHVDGNYNFCDPINDDLETFLQGRLQFISNAQTGWYKPVLDFLFVEYSKIEAEAAKAVEELDFLAPSTPLNFEDLLGISDLPESSTEPIDSDSESSAIFKDPFS